MSHARTICSFFTMHLACSTFEKQCWEEIMCRSEVGVPLQTWLWNPRRENIYIWLSHSGPFWPGPVFGWNDWCSCTGQQTGGGAALASPLFFCPHPKLAPPSGYGMGIPPMLLCFSPSLSPSSLPFQAAFFHTSIVPGRFIFSHLLPIHCCLSHTACWGWGTWHNKGWAPCLESSSSNLAATRALWIRHPPHSMLGALTLIRSMRQVVALEQHPRERKQNLGGCGEEISNFSYIG